MEGGSGSGSDGYGNGDGDVGGPWLTTHKSTGPDASCLGVLPPAPAPALALARKTPETVGSLVLVPV